MTDVKGPFIFVAIVIVGCLGAGVALATFTEQVTALVVSVVLACAVSSLLYGILGGVSQAGFNFGPLSMGGSAAVLLGSVFLFNKALEPQLREIRDYDMEVAVEKAVAAALQDARFDFYQHVEPNTNWFAINRATAVPTRIEFKDPQGTGSVKVVHRPHNPILRLRLEKQDENSFLVLGVNADSGDSLGYIQSQHLSNIIGSSEELAPSRIYGPQKLYLSLGGELAEDTPPEWGSSDRCLGRSLPMQLRVVSFRRGYANYQVSVCGTSGDAAVNHESSLSKGDAELVSFEIEGETRHFLIAVLAANHTGSPLWSSFLVIEMVEN